MSIQKYLEQIKPKQLFLIDSLGALFSAFMLGFVLVKLEEFIGMPREVLHYLALIAGIFTVHSFYCYLKVSKNWRPFLKAIAIANLLYCCLTLGLVIYLYPKLSNLGLIYFIVELIIVVILLTIEYKTALNAKEKV